MQLACRQQHPSSDAAQQQQQAAGREQPAADEGAQQAAASQQQGAAPGPGQRDKPIVVLVGATLDEPLVEHAVEQVGALFRHTCWVLAGWRDSACCGSSAKFGAAYLLPARLSGPAHVYCRAGCGTR